MKRIIKIILFSVFISTSSFAGSDGQNNLSKNPNGEVKDCFESINRGIFAFNQALDNIIVEPLAKGYRYLPAPIRAGTSNAISNLSSIEQLISLNNHPHQIEILSSIHSQISPLMLED